MGYKNEMDAGVVGGIANTENRNIVSRAVETAEGLEFGVPVVQGTLDKTCRATKAGDTVFTGVTLLDRSTLNDRFDQYDTARILIEGVVWVKVAEAVKAGDPVVVTVATGAFGKTEDSATAVAMANAFYDTSAAAEGLAQLRLK